MTAELLERRLEDLAHEAPDARRLSARVLAAGPRRGRRVWPRVSLSLVSAALLVVLVAYFVPAAGTVVARIPFAGDVVGANEHVTAVGSSSTSSGYTLTLTGAFADSTRTVLYIHSSPSIAFLGMDAALTDQFGRSYHSGNSSSDALHGDLVADFEALAWPDQITGARITLNVASVMTGVDPSSAVQGSWHMTATLGVDEGTSVAPPAEATLSGGRFKFTSVVYTPESIAIDIEMAGPTSQDAAAASPPTRANPKGSPLLDFEVFDEAGTPVLGSSEIDDGFLTSHAHLLANRDDSGGGVYTIRITFKGQSVDRKVTVS